MNSKTLYLLRHGKSDWSQPLSDFKRPLKRRGMLESVRIGTWLGENNHIPQKIISSTAVRALETTTLVSESIGLAKESIYAEDGLYMACENTLLDFIHAIPESVSRVMIVGHNPGLESLLLSLTGKAIPHADVFKVLPTATVVGLASEQQWKNIDQAPCQLEFIKRGKQL